MTVWKLMGMSNMKIENSRVLAAAKMKEDGKEVFVLKELVIREVSPSGKFVLVYVKDTGKEEWVTRKALQVIEYLDKDKYDEMEAEGDGRGEEEA